MNSNQAEALRRYQFACRRVTEVTQSPTATKESLVAARNSRDDAFRTMVSLVALREGETVQLAVARVYGGDL